MLRNRKNKNGFRKTTAAAAMLLILLVLPVFSQKAAAAVKQTDAKQTSVTFTWDKPTVSGEISKYDILYRNYNDSSSDYKTGPSLPGSATSATISGLKAGENYSVRVKYYYTTSYGSYDSYISGSDIVTLPGKVTGLKQDRWYYFIKQFDAVWDKQSGVSGYEYKCLKSSGKKQEAGKCEYASQNRATIEKISNEMIYSMQVRAYTKTGWNGKTVYGPWSDKVYFFTQPRITAAKVSGGRLQVRWAKVKGATGYSVYASTSKTKGYKRVKTVGAGKSYVSVAKLGKKKISGKKTYYVYIVTNKKVGKKTNTSGRLYYWNTKNTGYGYF